MFLRLLSVTLSENTLKTISDISKSTVSLELLLSIIAILISIFSIFFEYVWNKKINRINLEADFFKEIYGDYLMKEIPNARNYFHYNNHILSDTGDLIDVLNEIRRSSLFYKYKDKKFYIDLCVCLQGLEDELVGKEGKIFKDDDDYTEFISGINKDIEKLYSIIMNKYIGKK